MAIEILTSVIRWHRNLSLQTKFALQISLLVAAFFAILTPAVNWLQTRIVLEAARERGLQITGVFAHASVQAVAVDDFLEMRPLVNSVASQKSVLYAMLVDLSGRVITHNDVGQIHQTHSDPATHRALRTQQNLVQEIVYRNRMAYDFAVPVFVLNERRAVARVGMSLEPEYAAIRQTRNLVVGTGILGLVMGLMIAAWQAHTITRPVNRLVYGSEQISDGNLTHRISLTSNDELGYLAHAFNNMAESLRVRFEVDRELSSTLNLDVVLNTLVVHAQRLAGSNFAFLAYRRPGDATAMVAATVGTLGYSIHMWQVRPGHGRAGAVLVTGEAATQLDAGEDGDATEAAVVREEEIKAWILVPIRVMGDSLGLLGAAYRFSVEHTAAKQEMLQRLADEAAVAIANALAYREIEELTQTLERKVAARTLELSEANKQLEESQEKLRELDRLKSEFVSNVSHELRTPLATIRVSVENLLDGLAGEVNPILQRSLTRVKDNADRLTRLINDLLDLSRIESGRVEVHLAPVPVLPILQDVIEGFRGMAAEKGLAIAQTPDCNPLVALADRDKLHQVLVNLVGNAVKFTPAGGSVTVSARTVTAAGGQGAGVRGGTRFIEVEVADTGEGVPAEQLDMIFDKFYQVRRGNHHKTPGTGLGLAIARSLIELQGGRLWVESEIGRGSCFVFTLPLAESQ